MERNGDQAASKDANLEDKNSYKLDGNIPFLGKGIEWVVADQLQTFLYKTDFPDLFQSTLRSGCELSWSLDLPIGWPGQEKDRQNMTLLFLLDLSEAFDTIKHDIPLGKLSELRNRGTMVLLWPG